MAGRGEHKASVHRMDAAERQRQALILRRAGASYEQIAQQLGFTSRARAHESVSRALQRTLREPADELRTLELDRLDALMRGLWPAATQGDVAAVDRVLKVMVRRAKLLGLDAPIRFDVQRMVDEAAKTHGLTTEERDALFTEIMTDLAAARTESGA